MFIEVVSKHGKSFSGCAAYMLHDPARARTSDRVAWTATHQLGTDNPHKAWRVMAATAMNQNELKRQAGGSAAGAKPKGGPVLHYYIAWRRDELAGLPPDHRHAEMLKAAYGSLAVIGKDTTGSKRLKNGRRQFGDQHQALIVCHDDRDENHYHVHVMVNRVHPEHGVYLPDYNDQRKLQRFALKYEQQRDYIVCPQREVNAELRRLGIYVKADRKLPRHIYEAQRRVANDLGAKAELMEQTQAKAAEIAQRQREMKSRHRDENKALTADHEARVQAIKSATAKRIVAARKQAGRRLQTTLNELRQARRELVRDYYIKEQTAIGRIQNAFRSIDLVAVLTGRKPIKQGKAATLSEAFTLIGSAGARKQAMLKRYGLRKAQQLTVAKKALASSEQQIRAEEKQELHQNRDLRVRLRSELRLRHQADHAKVKAEWQAHDSAVRDKWAKLARQFPAPPREASEFDRHLSEISRALFADAGQQPGKAADRGQDESHER